MRNCHKTKKGAFRFFLIKRVFMKIIRMEKIKKWDSGNILQSEQAPPLERRKTFQTNKK